MKKENIIYGILAVLVITGIYFAFNSNKTTEVENPVKNIAKNEVKNVATGEIIETKTTEVVKVENNKTSKDVNNSNDPYADLTEKEILDLIKKDMEKDGIKFKKIIEIVSSKDVPDDFIDIHNLPADPGPENDLTLLGIDSNENGIRDDMERIIAYSFRDYPELVSYYNTYMIGYSKKIDDYENKRFDNETLDKNYRETQKRAICGILYKNKANIAIANHKISSILVNTNERRGADGRYGSMTNDYEHTLDFNQRYRVKKEDRGKVCSEFIKGH